MADAIEVDVFSVCARWIAGPLLLLKKYSAPAA